MNLKKIFNPVSVFLGATAIIVAGTAVAAFCVLSGGPLALGIGGVVVSGLASVAGQAYNSINRYG